MMSQQDGYYEVVAIYSNSLDTSMWPQEIQISISYDSVGQPERFAIMAIKEGRFLQERGRIISGLNIHQIQGLFDRGGSCRVILGDHQHGHDLKLPA